MFEIGGGIPTPEVVGDALLHIGCHGLQAFFTDFWKMSGFVDHSSVLPTHTESTGFTGVLGAHGLPQLPGPTGFAGLPNGINNGRPATATARTHHERFRSG